jgi:dnd system-associated protein 4
MKDLTELTERRVRRPEDKKSLLDSLTSPSGPFETLRDALVFAASVGYHNGKRIPFAKSSEQVPWAYFRDYEAFINMLATAVSGDPQVLGKDQHADKLQIFEEYANGGLSLIDDELRGNAVAAPLDVITDMVTKASSRDSVQEARDFNDLARDLVE